MFQILKIYKVNFIALICLALVIALFEAIGLAALAPVLSLILSGDGLLSKYIPQQYLNNKLALIQDLSIALSVVFLFKNTIIIGLKYISNKIVFDIKSKTETKLFAVLLNQNYENISKLKSSELSSKIMNEVQILTFNVLQALVVIASEFFIFTFATIALIVYDIKVFFIFIIPILSFIIPLYLVSSRFQKKWGKLNREANEGLYHNLEIAIGAYKEIVIFAAGKYLFDNFQKAAEKVAITYAKSSTLAMVSLPIIETLLITTLFTSLYFLYSLTLDITILSEVIGIYGIVSIRLLPGASRLITSINQVKFGMRSVEAIKDDLFTGLYCDKKHIKRDDKFEFNKLTFKNIDFSYRHKENIKDIFEDLNFAIDKNALIGIEGESGVGKSTLIGLILGLIKPTSGTIFVNNEILDNSNLHLFHSVIGYVPQDVYIVDGTLAENIAFGLNKKDIDYNLISYLVSLLGLSSLSNDQTLNYDIRLTGRGSSISGGQRARIGLARALYRNPQILILDEVTSGLDSETAELIIKNVVCDQRRNFTVIMISHQNKYFKNFDQVWKLKNKKIEFKINED